MKNMLKSVLEKFRVFNEFIKELGNAGAYALRR